MKRHATDDVDRPDKTLCGREMPADVDNANPDCKACLRVIAARLRRDQQVN